MPSSEFWTPDMIWSLMLNLGWTRERMAESLGIRRDTLQKYLAGSTKPSKPVIRLLNHRYAYWRGKVA